MGRKEYCRSVDRDGTALTLGVVCKVPPFPHPHPCPDTAPPCHVVARRNLGAAWSEPATTSTTLVVASAVAAAWFRVSHPRHVLRPGLVPFL